MFFTPKHRHCLGKRRTWMLQFLFCLNPSFTKGKKNHQISITGNNSCSERRGVVWQFQGSLSSRILSVLSPLAPIPLPRTGQDQGQGYFLGPKCRKACSPHLGFHSPPAPTSLARSGGLGLVRTLPPQGRAGEGSLDQLGLWLWSNPSCFSMDHWDTRTWHSPLGL